MYSAISHVLILFVNLCATVYVHIEDGLCVDLYDPKNMGGGAPNVFAITICGETQTACGTSGDSPGAKNPYYCEDCDTVTIYEFPFSISAATQTPTCQAVFTFPEDYGDVYYNSDGRLYDAKGMQIGDVYCLDQVQGKFENPWNSYPDKHSSITPCSSTVSPPAPSATCYYDANPDACPEQYELGWCYCYGESAMYPIMTTGQPCAYTVLPTTTTTSPICTATE